MHSCSTPASSRSVRAKLGLCTALAGTCRGDVLGRGRHRHDVRKYDNPRPGDAGRHLHQSGDRRYRHQRRHHPRLGLQPLPNRYGPGLLLEPRPRLAGQHGGGVATGPATNIYADFAATGGRGWPGLELHQRHSGHIPQGCNTGTHRLGFRFANAAGVFNFGYLTIDTTDGVGNWRAPPPPSEAGSSRTQAQRGCDIPAVPEPSSAALLALVAGSAGLRCWRAARAAPDLRADGRDLTFGLRT